MQNPRLLGQPALLPNHHDRSFSRRREAERRTPCRFQLGGPSQLGLHIFPAPPMTTPWAMVTTSVTRRKRQLASATSSQFEISCVCPLPSTPMKIDKPLQILCHSGGKLPGGAPEGRIAPKPDHPHRRIGIIVGVASPPGAVECATGVPGSDCHIDSPLIILLLLLLPRKGILTTLDPQ